jgi:hypothetical protein
LVDLLSIDSNEPDFFNNRSDEIEKRIDDIDAIFNIKYLSKNKDEASNIIILLLSSIKWVCLDFYMELLN